MALTGNKCETCGKMLLECNERQTHIEYIHETGGWSVFDWKFYCSRWCMIKHLWILFTHLFKVRYPKVKGILQKRRGEY